MGAGGVITGPAINGPFGAWDVLASMFAGHGAGRGGHTAQRYGSVLQTASGPLPMSSEWFPLFTATSSHGEFGKEPGLLWMLEHMQNRQILDRPP